MMWVKITLQSYNVMGKMLRCGIIIITWVLRNPHLLVKVEQILDVYFELLKNIYLNNVSEYGRCQFMLKNFTTSN